MSESILAVNWKSPKVIFGAVVVAIPAIVGVIEIYDRLVAKSGPNIVASATESNFALPGNFWELVEKEADSWPGQESKTKLPATGMNSAFSWLDTVVNVQIRNSGNLAANEVRLVLGQGDYGGIATITWDDGRTKNVEYTKDIELGTLEVEDAVRVTAWPRTMTPDELLITHSDGRMQVLLREPRTYGFFVMVVLPILAWAVVSALWVFINDYLRLKRYVQSVKKPTENDNSAQEIVKIESPAQPPDASNIN